MTRFGPLLLGALLTLGAAACGAADDGGSDNGDGGPGGVSTTDRVQVADIRFEGEFVVTSVTADGADVGLVSEPIISLETVFGGLSIVPGCNTYFGSFTLTEDGTASFTVAGGTSRSCADLADQEAAVLDALRAVTTWEEEGDGFRFADDGGGSTLTVSPA
ncbi:MAG: META domain-containing protein [Actinomycetota bacterium]